jgi:hypothetical protein
MVSSKQDTNQQLAGTSTLAGNSHLQERSRRLPEYTKQEQ